MIRLSRSAVVVLVFAISPLQKGTAAELNPNDILVSIGNSLAGSFVQLDSVREFTPAGSLVQTIPFNYNGGSYPSTDYLRDIVVDPNGQIQAYNGTFSPFLS